MRMNTRARPGIFVMAAFGVAVAFVVVYLVGVRDQHRAPIGGGEGGLQLLGGIVGRAAEAAGCF